MSGKRGLVVVVHSNAARLSAWIDALGGGGWRAIGVTDPDEALRLLGRERVRVVCVGGTPGGHSAWSVLRVFAQTHPSVSRVLLVTQTASPLTMEGLIQASAQAVVADTPERARPLAALEWGVAPSFDDPRDGETSREDMDVQDVARDEDDVYLLDELRGAVVIDRLVQSREGYRSTLPPADEQPTPTGSDDRPSPSTPTGW